MDGIVNGPFDPDVFGFGFENPLVSFPFISGFYDFDNIDGTTIRSRKLGDNLGGIDGPPLSCVPSSGIYPPTQKHP